jgi:hypothetical protein
MRKRIKTTAICCVIFLLLLCIGWGGYLRFTRKITLQRKIASEPKAVSIFNETLKKYENTKSYQAEGIAKTVLITNSLLFRHWSLEKTSFVTELKNSDNFQLEWKNYKPKSWSRFKVLSSEPSEQDSCSVFEEADNYSSEEVVIKTGKIEGKDNNVLFYSSNGNNISSEKVDNVSSGLNKLEKISRSEFELLRLITHDKTFSLIYPSLDSLKIVRMEKFDSVSCYVISGTALKENNDNGIFITLWIGEGDFLIRKLEILHVVENGRLCKQEIYRNISAQ